MAKVGQNILSFLSIAHSETGHIFVRLNTFSSIEIHKFRQFYHRRLLAILCPSHVAVLRN